MRNLSKENWVLFNAEADMEDAEGDELYFLGCVAEVVESMRDEICQINAEKAALRKEIERLKEGIAEAVKQLDISSDEQSWNGAEWAINDLRELL